MKTSIVIAFLMSAALVACGGKAKKSTTPDTTGPTQTQTGASGSAMGGSTYGGTMTGSAAMPSGGADPCAAK
jgi:polyisoprenoid-binding protein YceI